MQFNHSIFVIASIAATVATALDNSPPCIKSCYDSNPPPKWCNGVVKMTDEVLARCTCESFQAKPPLYTCIRKCPASEQAKYIVGLDQAYRCQEENFPDIKPAVGGTTAAPSKTSPASEDSATATNTKQATPTNGGNGFLGNSALRMFAVGGLFSLLVF